MQPKLKFLNRFLTLWIFIAMVIGICLGHLFPGISHVTNALVIGTTNIPLGIGLILMMYPPLAKVDYSLLPMVLRDKKVIGISLLLNWFIGPVLMFVLAVLFLKNEPDYMIGLILIGLARCIAMVIVWNDLAKGNREYAALLVALNSVFQILFYNLLFWLFIHILPQKLGLGNFNATITMKDVTENVLAYLGIPFAAGFFGRFLLVKSKGIEWYNRKFIPTISPISLGALLYTIILMFSLKGNKIITQPLDVIKITIPLILYFLLMFFASFFINKTLKVPYDKNVAIAFTATGNNFELAIAVAIAIFGIYSPQAFVGVIGPLIEVPIFILLVKMAEYLKIKYYSGFPNQS